MLIDDIFSFPHSGVTAEGVAAAAKMTCSCQELAIPLRLGLQAAGYVALGNGAWWAANQAMLADFTCVL